MRKSKKDIYSVRFVNGGNGGGRIEAYGESGGSSGGGSGCMYHNPDYEKFMRDVHSKRNTMKAQIREYKIKLENEKDTQKEKQSEQLKTLQDFIKYKKDLQEQEQKRMAEIMNTDLPPLHTKISKTQEEPKQNPIVSTIKSVFKKKPPKNMTIVE